VKKWENCYGTATTLDKVFKDCNEAGKDGWEMVTVFREGSDGYCYWLKREITEPQGCGVPAAMATHRKPVIPI